MYAGFKGDAKRLEDIDLPRIGYEIGVGEDIIHAIIDVEAPKSGFDAQGRPRILFEPHIFYRHLSGAKLQRAIGEGLAYKAWKRGAYGPESAQYGKLDRAIGIDANAALKACSWGRSQIMGFNHTLAGYRSVEAMVAEFCDDEDNHIEAMVRFIVSAGIDDELRVINRLNRPSTPQDWRPVALGYNGKGYEQNGYHISLARQHNFWRGKPDTPWSPETAVVTVVTDDPVPPAPAPRPEPAQPAPAPARPATPVAETAPRPPAAAPAPPPKPLSFWQRLFGRQ